MKLAWFTFIFLYPLIIFAADDAGDASIDASGAIEASSGSDHSMMRVEGQLEGYQPLTVAGQKIEATYQEETSGDEHGIIVFFHDQGDAFENKAITPLRHSFPEYGWSTITVALDYPYVPEIHLHDPQAVANQQAIGKAKQANEDAEAKKKADENKEPAWDDEEPEETPKVEIPEGETKEASKVEKLPPVSNIERLEAVMSFIQSKSVGRIIFVGHGKGGEKAVELLGQLKTPISALILIGTPELTTNEIWETLTFPILDVYGTNDSIYVAAAVKKRKKIMKKIASENYETREVVGADHVFYGLQPQLTSLIRSWLHRVFIASDDASAVDSDRPLVPVAR